MKVVKALSLAFIFSMSASGLYAAESVTAADPNFNGATANDALARPAQAAAPANTVSSVDPADVKAKAQQKLKEIFDYSLTLPLEKRKPYNDILYSGGFVIHKMKKGLVKPEDFDKSLKELDKFYEGDGKLTEKEAEKWLSTFRPLAQLTPPK